MSIIKDDAMRIKDKVKVALIVNGEEKGWDSKEISFDQVVILAFGSISNNPNICYTVTYKRGPGQNREGSMVKGDVVRVKNKMVFNVTSTDKS
ncbi:MAG: multiubiquitin domain-containing protein [Cyclobacteriaceae bacterium]